VLGSGWTLAVEFLILGPLEAIDGGRKLPGRRGPALRGCDRDEPADRRASLARPRTADQALATYRELGMETHAADARRFDTKLTPRFRGPQIDTRLVGENESPAAPRLGDRGEVIL
jgi:hypothetical protein